MSDKAETRSTWRRRLIILVASLCGLVLSASVTYLVLQHIDNRRINEQTSELIELASPQEIADSADTVIIGEDSEPTNNPYWDYNSATTKLSAGFKLVALILTTPLSKLQITATT